MATCKNKWLSEHQVSKNVCLKLDPKWIRIHVAEVVIVVAVIVFVVVVVTIIVVIIIIIIIIVVVVVVVVVIVSSSSSSSFRHRHHHHQNHAMAHMAGPYMAGHMARPDGHHHHYIIMSWPVWLGRICTHGVHPMAAAVAVAAAMRM